MDHRSRRQRVWGGLLAVALAMLTALPSQAVVFSIDATNAPPGIGPADILESFGGGNFRLAATAAELGLRSGDDITGLHNGAVAAWLLWFSVDRNSTGLPGTAVRQQGNGQAADIFVSGDLANLPAGQNALAIDNRELGLADGANIDAAYWFSWQPERAFLFTLAPNSPTLALLGATAGDILIHQPNNDMAVFRTAAQLGLQDGDVLDAFQLVESPTPGSFELLFSLAPGSPTLAAMSASAADILTPGANGPRVHTAAWQIGLNESDNLDVISGTFDCSREAKADDCKIPEPGSLPLAGLALTLVAGAAVARRRRGAT